MSELNSPPALATHEPHHALAVSSAALTMLAIFYLPVWMLIVSIAQSAAIEDAMAAGLGAVHFAAAVVAFVAAMICRRDDVRHGLLRLPRDVFGLLAVGLSTLFVPGATLATGNTLLDFLGRYGITGDSAVYTALSGIGFALIIAGAIGGLIAAVIALFRKDRSIAFTMPISAGLIVIAFIAGELLIGH